MQSPFVPMCDLCEVVLPAPGSILLPRPGANRFAGVVPARVDSPAEKGRGRNRINRRVVGAQSAP